jgi:hypothetical protein
VKARLVDDVRHRAKRHLSPFREWTFEAAVIVLFDPSYTVRRASRVPLTNLRESARWSAHVSGYIVHATNEVLHGGADWTARLRAVVLSDMID